MLKTIKWLAISSVTLIVLIGVALIAAVIWIDPNDYREDITAAIADRTGQNIALDGDIALTLFPRIALDLGRVALIDPPDFDNISSIRIDGLSLGLAPMPLLRRELVLDVVRAEQVAVGWVQKDRSVSSAAESSQPTTRTTMPVRNDSNNAVSSDTGGGFVLDSVAGIRVEALTVSIADEATGDTREVGPYTVRTGPIRPGAPVDLTVTGGPDTRLAGSQLTGTISLQPSQTPEIRFDLVLDTLNLNQASAPRNHLQPVALVPSSNTLPGLPENFDPTPIIDTLQTLSVDGQLRIGRLLAGGLEARQLDFQVNLDQGAIEIEATGTERTGGRFEAALSGTAANDEIDLGGPLNIAHTDLRALLRALDQPLGNAPNAEAFQRFSLSTTLALRLDQAQLNDFELVIDDSRATGDAILRQREALELAFATDLDTLNLDRYLEAFAAVADGTSPASAPGWRWSPVRSARAATPLTLPQLRIDGRIGVGELQVMGLNLQSLAASISSAEGLARIHPVSAELYQGTYQGDIRLDGRGGPFILAIDDQLRDISLGPLLNDLVGMNWIEGQADGDISIQASGLSTPELLQSLSGSLSLSLRDGLLRGINIAQQIRQAEAQLRGERTENGTAARTTDFSEADLRFRIEQGIAQAEQLAFRSPLFVMTGSGQVNLPTEALDLRLQVELLEQLRGTVVPLRIDGRLTEPRLRLDVEELLRDQVRDGIQRLLDRL